MRRMPPWDLLSFMPSPIRCSCSTGSVTTFSPMPSSPRAPGLKTSNPFSDIMTTTELCWLGRTIFPSRVSCWPMVESDRSLVVASNCCCATPDNVARPSDNTENISIFFINLLSLASAKSQSYASTSAELSHCQIRFLAT